MIHCFECINRFVDKNCYDCRMRETCECFKDMPESTKESMYERYIYKREPRVSRRVL